MFKAPFSFNGRIRRTEYGLTCLIRGALYFFVIEMNAQTHSDLWGLVYLPASWFLLAQGAKRCHDLDKSGWWQIIPFYVLWMIFEKGRPWPNQYDIAGEPYYGAEDYEKPFMIDENANPAISIPGEHGNTETPIS